jgi:hypothetical protein
VYSLLSIRPGISFGTILDVSSALSPNRHSPTLHGWDPGVFLGAGFEAALRTFGEVSDNLLAFLVSAIDTGDAEEKMKIFFMSYLEAI